MSEDKTSQDSKNDDPERRKEISNVTPLLPAKKKCDDPLPLDSPSKTFKNYRDSLNTSESLLLHFVKNPDKIRDWAIVLFFLWMIATGGITGTDLIKMMKGEEKAPTKIEQVSPPIVSP